MHDRAAFVLGCLATCLIIIGTLSPGWLIIDGASWENLIGVTWEGEQVVKIRFGLWYQQICNKDSCKTTEYPSYVYETHVFGMTGLTEFRMFTTCAILLNISAFILCILHIMEKSPKLTGVSAALMSVFTGIMIWLPAGKMLHRYIQFDNSLYQAGIQDNLVEFPYSTIICGIGGFLDFFSCVLIMISVRKMYKYSSEFKHKRMEMSTYC